MRLFGKPDGIVNGDDAGWLMMPPFRHERINLPPEIANGMTCQVILASLAVWLETLVGVPENIPVRITALAEETGRELLLLRLTNFRIRPYRQGNRPDFIDCQCEVLCWGWSEVNLARGAELADRVLAALQKKTIPLFDYRAEDVPLWGYLKLREGEVIDDSRSLRPEIGGVQRIYGVSIAGTAESVSRNAV